MNQDFYFNYAIWHLIILFLYFFFNFVNFFLSAIGKIVANIIDIIMSIIFPVTSLFFSIFLIFVYIFILYIMFAYGPDYPSLYLLGTFIIFILISVTRFNVERPEKTAPNIVDHSSLILWNKKTSVLAWVTSIGFWFEVLTQVLIASILAYLIPLKDSLENLGII